MIIHPYKIGSRSAKRLKEAINSTQDKSLCFILQRQPKNRRALVINWGSSEIAYPEGQCWIINSPKDVSVMSDKVKFFERIGHDGDVLVWTRSRDEALEWGKAPNGKVFARELTRGSGGRGIHVWTGSSEGALPVCPLYTKHQSKTHEFRLHMVRSLTGYEFIPALAQRKVWVKKDGEAPKSWDVRSHDNGFIFQAYPDLSKVPARVLEVATRCMAQHFPDMHFAALDILYHKPTDVAVVCEGNTAPGLENNSVDVYANFFVSLNEEFKKERLVQL